MGLLLYFLYFFCIIKLKKLCLVNTRNSVCRTAIEATSSKELKEHIAKHEDQPTKLVCIICETEFGRI